MTREYLVVYEKGATNWSAFSPDIPGCGSLGDTLKETRTNLNEAIELYRNETEKAAESLSDALRTNIDFADFGPDHQSEQYTVEWLEVALPKSQHQTETTHAA